MGAPRGGGSRRRRGPREPGYLPGVALPAPLTATHDVGEALDGADVVVLAVPSQTLRDNLSTWCGDLPPAAVLVSLAKGVERGTQLRMSQVVREVTGAGEDRVAVVTGPNLAREVALEQPTAAVVACADADVADRLQRACHTPYFRPYTDTDVVGCELGGAVKNVMALACGMAQGMGYGDNTVSALQTRGLAETARLGVALGADPLTFLGLAGLGDLVATCCSPLSRNRGFGEHLGRGMSVEEAVRATSQVAEGVKSCASVLALARTVGVEVPITEAVVGVVEGRLTPTQLVQRLMSRDATSEKSGVRAGASRG